MDNADVLKAVAFFDPDLKSFISGSFIQIREGFVNSYSIVQLDPCSAILWDVS
jgi:hypothetical protein